MPSHPVAANSDVRPWYRYAWPWWLMAGPAFVIVGGAYATWLAASTSDGLVADDYYKRGLAINQTLARADEAARRGLAALVTVDAGGGARVLLMTSRGAVLPSSLRLRLAHPTRAGADRGATLVRVADGVYSGDIGASVSGRWIVIVETDDWRLPPVEATGPLAAVALGASTAN